MKRPPGSVVAFMKSYSAGLRAGAVAVPCGDCSACCRSAIVPLTDEEVGQFLHVQVDDILALDKKDDGSCIYLEDGRCSIYSRRPRACRKFDCRALLLLGQQRGGAMAEALAQWSEFSQPTALDARILTTVRGVAAEAGPQTGAAEILKEAARRLDEGERLDLDKQ